MMMACAAESPILAFLPGDAARVKELCERGGVAVLCSDL
jgi:hypothetical protein